MALNSMTRCSQHGFRALVFKEGESYTFLKPLFLNHFLCLKVSNLIHKIKNASTECSLGRTKYYDTRDVCTKGRQWFRILFPFMQLIFSTIHYLHCYQR